MEAQRKTRMRTRNGSVDAVVAVAYTDDTFDDGASDDVAIVAVD